MVLVRSLVFAAAFYLWSAIMVLAMLPLIATPRPWLMGAMRMWARGTGVLLTAICGVEVNIRGREHMPTGRAIIAAKHQCMFDTMAPFAALSDACYVMRKELMRIPFYGWYCGRAGMIVVDRDAHSKALRKLVADARARLDEARQVVIFPEGHRMTPGAQADYKPGVAALYRDLGLPCTPLATNSGLHWPAHGFIRRPGTIVYEFLPPIPAGLRRAEFMRTLEERIEGASARLMTE
ncbi:MAG TPA: lysophospholipid acyltransferase family protein [Caulobacteraceae bacterium]|nr:lysophospholipid acyltransferase family protein [Caulobacteraceae bacterium]